MILLYASGLMLLSCYIQLLGSCLSHTPAVTTGESAKGKRKKHRGSNMIKQRNERIESRSIIYSIDREWMSSSARFYWLSLTHLSILPVRVCTHSSSSTGHTRRLSALSMGRASSYRRSLRPRYHPLQGRASPPRARSVWRFLASYVGCWTGGRMMRLDRLRMEGIRGGAGDADGVLAQKGLHVNPTAPGTTTSYAGSLMETRVDGMRSSFEGDDARGQPSQHEAGHHALRQGSRPIQHQRTRTPLSVFTRGAKPRALEAMRSATSTPSTQLAHLFDFQHERIHNGHTVPPNLDNQVDHRGCY